MLQPADWLAVAVAAAAADLEVGNGERRKKGGGTGIEEKRRRRDGRALSTPPKTSHSVSASGSVFDDVDKG